MSNEDKARLALDASSMRLKAMLVAGQACGSWPNEAQIAHAEAMLQLAHERAIKREGIDNDQPY
jgi:hypothetical protein